MTVKCLHHVNIHTSKIEETRRFFEIIAGFETVERPSNGELRGYWMYCGEVPVLHLREVPEGGVPRSQRDADGDGLDHIAFEAADIDGTRKLLESEGIACQERVLAEGTLLQLVCHDPNGVMVELSFDPVAEGRVPDQEKDRAKAPA